MGTIHAATQSTLAYNLKPLSSYALQAQTKEDTESEVIKLRDELFRLAKELVTHGPKSIKVAIIVQLDEDQIFHEYGSPDDVRGVVDSYLRLHGGIAKDIPSHRWKDSNFVDGQSVGTRSLTEAALIDPSRFDDPHSRPELQSRQVDHAGNMNTDATNPDSLGGPSLLQVRHEMGDHGARTDSSAYNTEAGHQQPPEGHRIEEIPVEDTSSKSDDSGFLQNFFSPLIMPLSIPTHPGEDSLVDSGYLNNRHSQTERWSQQADSAALAGLPSRAVLRTPHTAPLQAQSSSVGISRKPIPQRVSYNRRPTNTPERRPRPYPDPGALLNHPTRSGAAVPGGTHTQEAVQDAPPTRADSDVAPFPLVGSEGAGSTTGTRPSDF